MKRIAKNILSHLWMHDEKQILDQIATKEVVSFDVFDTLLKRDVSLPEDVFEMMERRLLRDGSFNEGFAKRRIQAQKEAYEVCVSHEVTLRDIYDHISVNEEEKKHLMCKECEIELQLCTSHIPVQRIYEECVRQGKKILFISDMYLPENTIWEMLKKNGYTTGKLYVSCECGVTKRHGELFAYVQRRERLDVKKWIHVGDSISSDYLAPRRIGIQSVLIIHDPRYNKIIHPKMYCGHSEYRALYHFINNRICRYTDPYDQVGYAVLGPLLYGFSRWLEKEIPQDTTIVFLSRAGALLQKAFQVVSVRHSLYFYISRHAAAVARFATANDASEVLQHRVRTLHNLYTVGDLAKNAGLSDTEFRRIYAQKKLDENCVVVTQRMERQVLDAIWNEAKEKASQQHSYLQRYIEQVGMSRKCALVDEGTYGTIQVLLDEALFKIKGNRIQWSGYYVGAVKGNIESPYFLMKKRGFLFENEKGEAFDAIRNSTPFFEMLFLATHGTTQAYAQTKDGRIYPVFGKASNQRHINDRINRIQNAGIQFVRDFSESALRDIEVPPEIYAGNYIAFARVPSLKTLKLFSDFKVDDDTYKLMSEHSLMYYLFHLKQFYGDFKKHQGKAWFMKSIFKIPLPYITMLNWMRKVFCLDK